MSAMEEKKWLIFFGLIVVVLGGTLLVFYSGSATMKVAVAHNKLCQNLKEMGSSKYGDCQSALDTFVELLLESKELDLHDCKGDKTMVSCPVRVWYLVRHLVITSPSIVKQAIHINPQPVVETESHQFDSILRDGRFSRRKREVLRSQKLMKKMKGKCCSQRGGCCRN